MSVGSMDALPSREIISNILTRLPLKSICRFKCVSKFWHSIISDPDFAAAHFERSKLHPKVLISIAVDSRHERWSGALFFSTDVSNQDQTLTFHSFIRAPGLNRISTSVRGLVCISSSESAIICNPSTRESMVLRSPRSKNDGNGVFLLRDTLLGFDPVQRKHKVLHRKAARFSGHEKNSVILPLEEDKWRRVDDDPNMFEIPGKYDQKIHVGGAIYYTAYDHFQRNYEPGRAFKPLYHYEINQEPQRRLEYRLVGAVRPCMVAYDLAQEKFMKITDPSKSRLFGDPMIMVELLGHVALVEFTRYCVRPYWIKVWRLNEELQNWSCTTCELPEYCSEGKIVPSQIKPVGTIHTGEIVFAPTRLRKSLRLFYYDMWSNTVRRSKFRSRELGRYLSTKYHPRIMVSSHVESIQSLGPEPPSSFDDEQSSCFCF